MTLTEALAEIAILNQVIDKQRAALNPQSKRILVSSCACLGMGEQRAPTCKQWEVCRRLMT